MHTVLFQPEGHHAPLKAMAPQFATDKRLAVRREHSLERHQKENQPPPQEVISFAFSFDTFIYPVRMFEIAVTELL